MPLRSTLMVRGSVALRNCIAAQVPALKRFLPRSVRILRMRMVTSPKSILTGHGGWHLWQHGAVVGDVVHLVEVFERETAPVCSSYRKASIITRPVPRILLRGEYSRLARGTWVMHLGFALAAAQAVLDVVVERAEFALLEDDRLLLHQPQ